MRSLLVLFFLLALPGCITPQVLVHAKENRIWLGEFPYGSEVVELPVPDGSVLRGVFVPGDPGAPVVLHLLESGGSVTKGTQSVPSYRVLNDLRSLGFASLVVDYRGNGVSTGTLSAENFREDAKLMFDEAVRRAGGPGRVVVRAMSIGVLPAAALLEAGCTPRALVLLAPVRAETVSKHYIDGRYSRPWSWILRGLVLQPCDVDLNGAVASAHCPTVVIIGGADDFLPPDESGQLAASVMSARNEHSRFISHGDLGHVESTLAFHSLQPQERGLLSLLFPEFPDVEARVRAVLGEFSDPNPFQPRERENLSWVAEKWNPQPPLLAGALAVRLCDLDGERRESIVRWLRSLSSVRLGELSWEELLALVDFSDPRGALDPREIQSLAGFAYRARYPADGKPRVEQLVEIAIEEQLYERTLLAKREEQPQDPELVRGDLDMFADWGEFVPDPTVARLSLPPRESLRQVVRLLLKSLAIPERVRTGAEGAVEIEYLEGAHVGRITDCWVRLPLPEIVHP